VVDALTVATLGSPSTARCAVAAALAGRRVAAAEATLVIAGVDGVDDENRLLGELRLARLARPDDRLVVVVESVDSTTGRRIQAHADAMVRLHPRCGGRAADAALAARRVERALSAVGVLEPPSLPRRRLVPGWLTAAVSRRLARGRGGLAAG